MDLDKIKNANTRYIGKNIIYNQQMKSTQEVAKEYLSKPNGTLIITDEQINGIGTKGRKWFSGKEENITMTIILKPDYSVEHLNGLTLKIAEAIRCAIKELYGYELTIKEPNDLLLNGKKICGILTQCSSINNKVNYVLIGIGFNVNQGNFNKELRDEATSLKNEYNKVFNREEIICRIIENIENVIFSFKVNLNY